MVDPVPGLMAQLSPELMRQRLYYLAQDPLPYRKLNYVLPGHTKSTLDEADDYLQAQLESFGYAVEKEPVPVQAYRCGASKPKSHQYSAPAPEDPWYTAHNLYARKAGRERPEEIIVVISHKDSQSWVDSPGANDNAVGTVANWELARVLAGHETCRSIWFVGCNEEHSPWTSVTAAQRARERGDDIIAVFNLDGLGRKSDEDHAAGLLAHVALFTTPEGERLADLVGAVIADYALDLRFSTYERPQPGDDDGAFVQAGYGAAIANIGSYPYADSEYHKEGDTPDRVDLPNALRSAQAVLAAILRVDQDGAP